MSPEIILDPYAELFSQTCGMVRSSAVRDLMSITGRSDVISFAGGLPYIGGLSADEIAPVIADIVEQGYEEALQYGETEGRDSLKEQLAALMAEEGNPGEPEHMMVTTGSQQALDLLGRALIDAGDAIIVEGPTYIGALSAFCPCGPRIITVPVDDMGIRTDLLARELDGLAPERPKFIYVVPNFQNPAGVTTAERRREELLALAAERDILVIEDNPYGLVRFEGEPLEPLSVRDRRRVIYVGTLSKIVSPGIRVGWVQAPAPVIDRLAALKQGADLCSSSFNQMFAESYLRRGLWRENLARLLPLYRSRRDAMLGALEEHFPPEASWTRPEGGLFLWATLPGYLDTNSMLPLAINRKVAYVPGTAFFTDGSGADRMRLNFSYESEVAIEEGIKRLGKVIAREMELSRALGLDRPRSGHPRGGDDEG